MKKKILFLISLLMVVSMACTITIPVNQPDTQEIREFQISEDLNQINPPLELVVNMGAGKLKINPGIGKVLSGKIQYNFPPLNPTLSRNGNKVEISQTEEINATIPLGKMVNSWELLLANIPTDLTINAGAYEGDIDLSGIPIKSLSITDGASNTEVLFQEINPVDMEFLSYTTGASNVSLKGLANANFKEMSFSGGAGAYLLDFRGELRNESAVNINLGVGSMTIVIPPGLPTNITFNGELTNVNFKGVWAIEDKVYITEGDGPVLNMVIDINLGRLELIHEGEVVSLP